jgi:hypothetical protein
MFAGAQVVFLAVRARHTEIRAVEARRLFWRVRLFDPEIGAVGLIFVWNLHHRLTSNNAVFLSTGEATWQS